MSRQALYRKYRSRSLDEVIGQEHVTEVLASAIEKKAFSHAYLFTGPRGIGKTSVARIVAYMVNDLKYGETSFDIIEIDAASHGLKEDIKDLIEKARIAPTREKYKVYIIDEVHSMKHDAFNTFLKLLEEPPEHVMFILATTDPQKLPATILSRTQRFHFRPVEQDKVVQHLKNIAEKEKIDIDDEALKLVAQRGEGSMRDSISLLDQLSGFGKKITADVVEELLGLVPSDQINEVIEALNKQDIKKVSQVLIKLKGDGISPSTIIKQLNLALLEKEQYDLIDKLLDAPRSVDPWLKIIAVLGASIEAKPKSEAKKPEKKAPAIETSAASKVEEIKVEYKKEVREEREEVSEETASESSAKTEKKVEKTEGVKETVAESKPKEGSPKEIDWEKVVEEAKKINVPYSAWIAHAYQEYDGETLTLYFKSKLHRNIIKEDKCWKTLRGALKALYENPPTVVVSDGPKPKSEVVSKVADIMGGGEVV